MHWGVHLSWVVTTWWTSFDIGCTACMQLVICVIDRVIAVGIQQPAAIALTHDL